MALVARHSNTLTQEVGRALTKPQGLTNDQWQATQKAIMLRREQPEERLARGDDRLGNPDSGERLLRALL